MSEALNLNVCTVIIGAILFSHCMWDIVDIMSVFYDVHISQHSMRISAGEAAITITINSCLAGTRLYRRWLLGRLGQSISKDSPLAIVHKVYFVLTLKPVTKL